MKVTLEIDGEIFEAENWSFETVLQELGEKAGLIEEDETIKVLSPDQLQGANHV